VCASREPVRVKKRDRARELCTTLKWSGREMEREFYLHKFVTLLQLCNLHQSGFDARGFMMVLIIIIIFICACVRGCLVRSLLCVV
jgi:hypothetical protein